MVVVVVEKEEERCAARGAPLYTSHNNESIRSAERHNMVEVEAINLVPASHQPPGRCTFFISFITDLCIIAMHVAHCSKPSLSRSLLQGTKEVGCVQT
jgi:hypothetical protein